MGAIKGLKKKVANKGKKQLLKFTVDCQQPADDTIITPSDLEKFFKERIKVAGKTGNLGVTYIGDKYMWSEHLVVIVGFRLWGISKIYKIYTNIYKIYTKYQAAAAQPGSEAPGPALGRASGSGRAAAAWDFVYILHIFVYILYIFDMPQSRKPTMTTKCSDHMSLSPNV